MYGHDGASNNVAPNIRSNIVAGPIMTIRGGGGGGGGGGKKTSRKIMWYMGKYLYVVDAEGLLNTVNLIR